MFPIGKFTLSIIGLRLFGGYGFLWGMFLGHMLIDRTILRKIIKQYISTIDDNIRIMLPYKYYRYYSRIENSIFGILYGSILGAVTFGFPGFIVFFLLGHLFFDLPDNQHFSRFRSFFETFWNEHWGKILGVLIGLSLHSNWIIVIGVILGFVLDYYRFKGLEAPQKLSILKQFWLKLNLLKLYLHSKEARKFALIQAMTGLSAKVAKADGQVTENEIRTFKKLFELENDSDSKVKDIFNYNKSSTVGYEKYAKQLRLIVQDNLELKENIIENLFKIASADGSPARASKEKSPTGLLPSSAGRVSRNFLLPRTSTFFKSEAGAASAHFVITSGPTPAGSPIVTASFLNISAIFVYLWQDV